MNLVYRSSWMGKCFEYELTSTELIIRLEKKDKRIPLNKITAATYVKPAQRISPSRTTIKSPSTLKKELVKSIMHSAGNLMMHRGMLFLRIQDESFRLQSICFMLPGGRAFSLRVQKYFSWE